MVMLMVATPHTPVLVEAALHALQVSPGGRYIDATVGSGGHSLAILQHSSPGGRLLGIDADPEAIHLARSRLTPQAILVNANFAQLEIVASIYDFAPVDGVIYDLGMSSMQLGEAGRGFSFSHDAPLDMRFDPHQELTAADIVNRYTEAELARLLYQYGQEPAGRKIARHITDRRPLHTTLELAGVIAEAVGSRRGRLHPATRSFQAIRIAVNRELENLAQSLPQAVKLLRRGGRLVVIAYHSLEDRLAKQFMAQEAKGCICPPRTPTCLCGHSPSLKLVTRKVITPSPEEIKRNPRSRSAKLRAAEKV